MLWTQDEPVERLSGAVRTRSDGRGRAALEADGSAGGGSEPGRDR